MRRKGRGKVKQLHLVSVRTLAEFACASGSVGFAPSASRLREGREGHAALQEILGPEWQLEAPIAQEMELEDVLLRIQGRADAICITDDMLRIVEIKTTRQDVQNIESGDYPVHWAQGEIYAWLFCRQTGCRRAEVALIYANSRGGKRRFIRKYDFAEIDRRCMGYAHPYAQWLRAGDEWREEAELSRRTLQFPFENFRDGQRTMAKYVYAAMAKQSRTLIEAPTGIGKTAASLFGAMKALGEGKITSVFYLTARTTGRRSAENALDLMRKNGLKARSTTLTAKEKICLRGKPDCGICPYGMGYYDRRREALKRAMRIEVFDREAIEALAQAFELCPFELSLDLTDISDVIICDYNYVFDPRVRLKRHFDRKSRAGLLIDEAHNLPERAREMYSAVLSGERVAGLMRRNQEAFGEDDPLHGVLAALLQTLTIADAEYEARRDVPEEMIRAAEGFAELAEKLRIGDEELVLLAQEAAWFARVGKRFDEDSYRLLIRPDGAYIEAKLWCFAPEKHLEKLFSRVGGAALFSATLTPIDFYASLLAVPDRQAWLKLESPFPQENLFAARIPISVKFRDREDSMEQVVRVIRAMAQAHTGNYMACFPSHQYLMQAYRYYRIRFPEDSVFCQEAKMSEKRRMEFISAFRPSPEKSTIGFVVLGGVFSEGVDLPDDLLSGAAIVSTGIPMVNPEAEMLREVYDDGMDGGYDAAYTYPGFRRVLQAAGRVIRTETDRGVVLLLDARYGSEKYLSLMPPHWKLRKFASMSKLNAALRTFWKQDD